MEHPRLPEFPTLGTLAGDVDEYYSGQAKDDNQLRLKTFEELENEELMSKWEGIEYMDQVKWPEEKLKKVYKIEMCFSYPDEVDENGFMWCCGVVERFNTRDGKVIKLDIKWDEQFIVCGESEKIEEILKTFVEYYHTEERGMEAGHAIILEEN